MTAYNLTVTQLDDYPMRRFVMRCDDDGWRSREVYVSLNLNDEQQVEQLCRRLNELGMDYLFWKHGEPGWREVWKRDGVDMMSNLKRAMAQ